MKRIQNDVLSSAYPWLLTIIGKSALQAWCPGAVVPRIILRHWLERHVVVHHETIRSCNMVQCPRMYILPTRVPVLKNYFFVQRVHFFIFFHLPARGDIAYTHCYPIPWGGVVLQDCLALLVNRGVEIDAIIRNNLLTDDRENCISDSYIIYD